MEWRLISPEVPVREEAAMVADFFDRALDYYHYRKSNFERKVFARFLEQLPECFHSRIFLHLKEIPEETFEHIGFHLKGQLYASDLSDFIEEEKSEGRKFSAGAHDEAELNAVQAWADAVLVSPVFPSISKLNYQAEDPGFFQKALEQVPNCTALGGIGKNQIRQIREIGFQSCALMGAVWKGDSDPLENFEQIKNQIHE
ncbi:thiamine phosphate synthase [Persicobacter sp. CCB-QB2]|uniref:thiamine phosphate synthase n=1 Tax=Persicobacter sp. CCB-QB2 TaxID=1561025 RepID=UPI0006A947C9|nr:thiamine phosphate synthase [Persicobacter sp. CCB-QB2]